jgi:tetratricopeptide (TPR) repeat protein
MENSEQLKATRQLCSSRMSRLRMGVCVVIGACWLSSVWFLAAVAEDGGAEGKGDWSAALPYYNRANKRLNESRYDEAVQDFNDAIARYPGDPDFYTNLGIALRKLGKYGDAEQAYKKAIKLNPKDWVPWSDLANVYLKQDKLKETVATFEEVLKHDPPAAEKEAIKKDITDIKKIMSMQGTATTNEAATPEVTPAWQPGDNVKPSAAKTGKPISTGLKRSDIRASQATNSVKDATAVDKLAPVATGTAPGTTSSQAAKKSPAVSQPKDSDWGYSSK